MRRFTQLYLELDSTTSTLQKVAAISRYFAEAEPRDAAWAIFFLSGGKLKQLVPTRFLRDWAAEAAGIETWLFDECHDVVGDLAETMALVLPDSGSSSNLSLAEMMDVLTPLRNMPVLLQRETLFEAWRQLTAPQRFVMHKLITGALRVGVSHALLLRGLSEALKVPTAVLAHRLMGTWEPTPESFSRLSREGDEGTEVSRPYPFMLAHPVAEPVEQLLGSVESWQAEWKWDGIRAQLIRRAGELYLWTRGEELVVERFPEVIGGAQLLDDGVFDGEILGWSGDRVLPFADLQRRIGRKNLSARILQEVPVVLMAFDCLERAGQDIRSLALSERRQILEQLVLHADGSLRSPRIRPSPLLTASRWSDLRGFRDQARSYAAEGLMLKRRTAPYRPGRVTGDWWKWKIDPYTIDAVLIYAQRGHGKRANLYTDYTFAVWSNDELVPVAKAYSGLTDAEIAKVDQFVRRNSLESFGPVRSVKPELVFELAFEDIRLSKRHKSGIAVRFPRIVRWRTDKTIHDADTLQTIKAMLAKEEPT